MNKHQENKIKKYSTDINKIIEDKISIQIWIKMPLTDKNINFIADSEIKTLLQGTLNVSLKFLCICIFRDEISLSYEVIE